MSYPWLNNSQNSTGFVYFNLDTTPVDESPDFLKFNDSPSPQPRRFNPTNFSSPYHNRRASPRGYNKRGRKHTSNQQNALYSPNNSCNASGYSNSSWIKSRDSSFNNKSRNDSFTKSNFLHPSFMEDPWADLENQLNAKEKQEQNNSSNTLNQSASSTSNISSSSSNRRNLPDT